MGAFHDQHHKRARELRQGWGRPAANPARNARRKAIQYLGGIRQFKKKVHNHD